MQLFFKVCGVAVLFLAVSSLEMFFILEFFEGLTRKVNKSAAVPPILK